MKNFVLNYERQLVDSCDNNGRAEPIQINFINLRMERVSPRCSREEQPMKQNNSWIVVLNWRGSLAGATWAIEGNEQIWKVCELTKSERGRWRPGGGSQPTNHKTNKFMALNEFVIVLLVLLVASGAATLFINSAPPTKTKSCLWLVGCVDWRDIITVNRLHRN